MIKSFADRQTRGLFETGVSRRWNSIARVAVRKLVQIDSVATLDELNAPPGNRLEALTGCGKTPFFSEIRNLHYAELKADCSQVAAQITNLFFLRPFSAALPLFGHTSPLTHTAPTGLASSFRIRTRLYAAAANVNIQPTFSIPRCRTFRINAIVFNHPKHSSIRFRFF